MESSKNDKPKLNNKLLEFSRGALLHDLMPPLTTIHGYSDILLMEAQGPINDLQRNSIQKIEQAAKRIKGYLWEYESLALIESGYLLKDQKAIDLISLLNRVVEKLQPELDAEEKVLQITTTKSMPTFVRAKERCLYQIFHELIEHAHLCSANNERSFITITPEKKRVHTTIKTTSYSKATLTKPYLPGLRLFEIVKRFIEQFGGEFGEENEEGKGSIVWFTLPIANEPTEQE